MILNNNGKEYEIRAMVCGIGIENPISAGALGPAGVVAATLIVDGVYVGYAILEDEGVYKIRVENAGFDIAELFDRVDYIITARGKTANRQTRFEFWNDLFESALQ